MKILLLNWKDQHHPLAGGAEDYTFNIMRRLVSKGHQVQWFSSLYPKAARSTIEEGIAYIRDGTYRTVQGRSKKFLKSLSPSDKPDVIIDEVNTRPFNPSRFLESKIPTVNLIHQLAREVWFQEVPFPLALVGRYVLEDHWLKQIRDHYTITVSKSTESDLRQLGFNRVQIVYNALPDNNNSKVGPKETPIHFVYLGRLSKGKRPRDCLEAFRKVRLTVDCSMTVIGTGPLLDDLRRKYTDITFLGHVSEVEKHEVLSRASILLAAGTREGWNRSVLEAQSHGVIPIVQDVPGLRDAVDNGKAGIVVPTRSSSAMSKAAESLILNPTIMHHLSESSIRWSRQFTYSKSTLEFESILKQQISPRQPGFNRGNLNVRFDDSAKVKPPFI